MTKLGSVSSWNLAKLTYSKQVFSHKEIFKNILLNKQIDAENLRYKHSNNSQIWMAKNSILSHLCKYCSEYEIERPKSFKLHTVYVQNWKDLLARVRDKSNICSFCVKSSRINLLSLAVILKYERDTADIRVAVGILTAFRNTIFTDFQTIWQGRW